MSACEAFRSRLFLLAEDGIPVGERRQIEAHVEACEACRRELAEERALTSLLTGRPRRRRAALPTLGAAAVLLAVLLLQPGTDAYGSIEPRTLTPEMTRRDGARTRLERSNHVEVPTGDMCRIRIRDVGTLQAEGPAMFELEQGGRIWKLVLLQGDVRADVEDGAELVVVTPRGRQVLFGGAHFVCLQMGDVQPVAAPAKTVDELLAEGHAAFFEKKDFREAERTYREALEHRRATPAQRERARFYLGASLGRQGKFAEAIEVQEEWLKRNPEDKSFHYVLFFQGIYFWEMGKEEEGRARWRTIVREAPDSPMGKIAAEKLAGGHSASRRARPDPGYAPPRTLSADAGRPGGYLVVAVATDRAFREVAGKAAAFHKGRVVDFDGRDFDGLGKILREARPRNVLFVVPPGVLDVNLHRRLLLTSAGLDEDIFPDFAFGYLTARDGAALAALWERTVAVHRDGLASKRWIRSAVIRRQAYLSPGSVDALARAAGFSGDTVYWGTEGTTAEKLAFVKENLPVLEGAAVIAMTGCGDPQGTWLFADSRNAEDDRHWDFDPARVGHDPDGEMPRITAAHLRPLHLASPIVFTGVCHAGATRRVFVEGDIVSTFGRTKGISTVYELSPEESYALAMIDAGAVAYVCPIAANHGASVARETTFLLTQGASLGETIKSTYDEVYLASRGDLVLDFPVAGEPPRTAEYVMQGGGANRILIGDPALQPLEATAHPTERVEIRNRSAKGFDVVVTWDDGYHAHAWDMYREDRIRDWSVRARIPLDGLVPPRGVAITADVQATGRDGKPLPYTITHAEPEAFHGKRYLHLQAAAPRQPVVVANVYVQAVFRVTFE